MYLNEWTHVNRRKTTADKQRTDEEETEEQIRQKMKELKREISCVEPESLHTKLRGRERERTKEKQRATTRLRQLLNARSKLTNNRDWTYLKHTHIWKYLHNCFLKTLLSHFHVVLNKRKMIILQHKSSCGLAMKLRITITAIYKSERERERRTNTHQK